MHPTFDSVVSLLFQRDDLSVQMSAKVALTCTSVAHSAALYEHQVAFVNRKYIQGYFVALDDLCETFPEYAEQWWANILRGLIGARHVRDPKMLLVMLQEAVNVQMFNAVEELVSLHRILLTAKPGKMLSVTQRAYAFTHVHNLWGDQTTRGMQVDGKTLVLLNQSGRFLKHEYTPLVQDRLLPRDRAFIFGHVLNSENVI